MRKIVAGLFLTLDGVMEAPEQWQFAYFNDEVGAKVQGGMAEADALLLGRKTYEIFAAHWPNQGPDDPMAEALNTIPKYVVSTTLDTVEWQNSTLINGDVAQRIAELKQQPGKDITITGSATLMRSLLGYGLLDELGLLVHPLVLGKGGRLFEEGGEQYGLKLVEAKPFKTGVLSLTYQPTSG